MDRPDISHTARLATYSAVSTHLALLSDRQLAELVGKAPLIGSGIGGAAVLLDIDGISVFAKKVPLTDIERRPENVMSTANIFQLPTLCQYGVGLIGSPGFGVWRELAVHTMTTNWVLGNQHHSFPLMYHWRVLPEPSPSMPEELDDVDRAVAYLAGSPAVRGRLEAIKESSANVVLFLEYIPQTVHEWLSTQIAEGGEAAESAYAMVENSLRAGTSFMNSRGLLHFDAHFRNILTDGKRLYFTDFGLAVCSRFELSEAESEFFQNHLSYDRCYTATHQVNWLATTLYGEANREACVRDWAQGKNPGNLPMSAAAIVMRYAPTTVVMNEFFRELRNESRTTPYPAEEIQRVYAMTDFPLAR